MKILIAYATNSGSTHFAGEYIQELLKKHKHSVTIQQIKDTKLSSFSKYNVVIFGTNTWYYNQDQGQPHIWYNDIREQFPKEDFSKSKLKFAVYACGDSSYSQFCKSADHLESMIEEGKGKRIVDALKIDGYYRNEQGSHEKIEKWVAELEKTI